MAFVNGFFLIFPKKIKNPANDREIGANAGISGIQHTKNPAAKVPFYARFGCIDGVILFCKLRRKKIEKPLETYCFRWFWYVEKRSFIPFSKTLKGLGNEGVNTFASQMPAINGCPHLLRCGVPQLESTVGIHFRRGKTGVSRLLN